MARRRLLTLLASSALLVGVFAGPAAADDLVAPADVAVEVAESAPAAALDTAVAAVEEAAPVAAVDAVEDVAEAAPVAAPTPEPEPAPAPASPAPARSAASAAAPVEREDGLVAAGDVTSAPPIDLLISLGGSEATPGRGQAVPVATPMSAPVQATTDEVEAPLVAPAPAPAPTASAPSVLAQALDDLPAEGTPALALVALAALLAAGAGTVQTARAESLA